MYVCDQARKKFCDFQEEEKMIERCRLNTLRMWYKLQVFINYFNFSDKFFSFKGVKCLAFLY